MSGRSDPKPAAGAPPLRPFGLLLHADGSWTHQGIPIRHARLRAAFDRGDGTVNVLDLIDLLLVFGTACP